MPVDEPLSAHAQCRVGIVSPIEHIVGNFLGHIPGPDVANHLVWTTLRGGTGASCLSTGLREQGTPVGRRIEEIDPRCRQRTCIREYNVGDVGHDLAVILSGKVELFRQLESGARKALPLQGPGEVLGEMAQLAGQATLVDGRAVGSVEALLISVWVLVRGAGLEASMSKYLIDRIVALPDVEVATQALVPGLEGRDGRLESARAAFRRAQCPHHVAPAFRGIPRPSDRNHGACERILNLKCLNAIYAPSHRPAQQDRGSCSSAAIF
jgi:Cyclic nucleotide-binding domain